ncbi:MAG: ABC transporter ATP-binding protein [Thermoplasmata archaeon]
MEIINVRNLSFRYNSKTILNNINFGLERDQIVGILGPNGAGKSTIIKILGGILEYEGSIKLTDIELKNFKRKELARVIAVVPQNFEPGFDFKVSDLVMMGRTPYLKMFESVSQEDFNIVEDTMKVTDIMHIKDKSIREISGGERQRVIIAMAIAQDPKILLLDEPNANLDLKYQISIFELLKNLVRTKHISIIVAMHDVNLAVKYCNKIMLLNKGEIVQFDAPEKVITEENIKKVYEIDSSIIKDGNGSLTYIIPIAR